MASDGSSPADGGGGGPADQCVRISVKLPIIYAYGDDDYEDVGFGCLYRCAQTLRAFYGLSHMLVPEMMQVLGMMPVASGVGRLHPSAPARSGLRDVTEVWAEPSDVARLLEADNPVPKSRLVRLFVYSRDYRSAKRLLQRHPVRATMNAYDQLLTTEDWLWRVLCTTLTDGHPLVVDNKTYAYVVYGVVIDIAKGARTVLLADPHAAPDTNPSRTFTMDFYTMAKQQWMIATCSGLALALG
jgi:hypothetical protein